LYGLPDWFDLTAGDAGRSSARQLLHGWRARLLLSQVVGWCHYESALVPDWLLQVGSSRDYCLTLSAGRQ
jgi:hypothetical protein